MVGQTRYFLAPTETIELYVLRMWESNPPCIGYEPIGRPLSTIRDVPTKLKYFANIPKLSQTFLNLNGKK